jgi:hypothetical protein
MRLFSFIAVAAALSLFLSACPIASRSEGLDPSTLPSDVRADYSVFAQRCSKCHSLARPLNSGIDDDDYWVMYVARMRRQPASGISQEDTVPILRFLHFFSLEQRKKKEKPTEVDGSAPTPPAAPSAAIGTQ